MSHKLCPNNTALDTSVLTLNLEPVKHLYCDQYVHPGRWASGPASDRLFLYVNWTYMNAVDKNNRSSYTGVYNCCLTATVL